MKLGIYSHLRFETIRRTKFDILQFFSKMKNPPYVHA